MKQTTKIKILSLTLTLSLFSWPVLAAEQYFYAGIRAATVSVDEKEIEKKKLTI
jgi:hypothetical protein